MTSHQHPASIQELAERAEQLNVWETTRDFKQWLKAAERARHAGQSHDQSKDLENAFVEYARAATLILDKIPTHKEYYTRLDGVQRDTLLTVSSSFFVCPGAARRFHPYFVFALRKESRCLIGWIK